MVAVTGRGNRRGGVGVFCCGVAEVTVSLGCEFSILRSSRLCGMCEECSG